MNVAHGSSCTPPYFSAVFSKLNRLIAAAEFWCIFRGFAFDWSVNILRFSNNFTRSRRALAFQKVPSPNLVEADELHQLIVLYMDILIAYSWGTSAQEDLTTETWNIFEQLVFSALGNYLNTIQSCGFELKCNTSVSVSPSTWQPAEW